MKLSQTVGLGAALAVLPLVAGLGFTIDKLQDLASQSERLMLRQLTAVRMGTGVAARLDRLSEYQSKFAVSRDPGYAQKAEEVAGAIDAELLALEHANPGTGADADLADFIARWRLYRSGQPHLRLVASVEEAGLASVTATLWDAADAEQQELVGLALAARELLIRAHKAAVADVASASATREAAWSAAITATIVALLSSASVLVLVVRSVRQRLDAFVHATVAVSQGAFSAQLPAGGDDELGRVAKAFNQMVTALAQLKRLKSDFLSSISHELRTPLVAMVETNEALLDDVAGPLTERQRRMISLNAGAARRLSLMIGDLLELSVVRSGLRYRMAPTQLAEVVIDAASELDARARDRGLLLQVFTEESRLFPPGGSRSAPAGGPEPGGERHQAHPLRRAHRGLLRRLPRDAVPCLTQRPQVARDRWPCSGWTTPGRASLPSTASASSRSSSGGRVSPRMGWDSAWRSAARSPMPTAARLDSGRAPRRGLICVALPLEAA